MRYYLFPILVISIFFFMHSSLHAENNKEFYVGGHLGIGAASQLAITEIGDDKDTLMIETGSSAIAELLFGIKLFDFLRSELDYTFRPQYKLKERTTENNSSNTKIKREFDSEISAHSLHANFILEKKINTITPMLGIGLGVSFLRIEDITIKQNGFIIREFQANTETNFSSHVFAGMSIAISEKLMATWVLRFASLGKLKSGAPIQESQGSADILDAKFETESSFKAIDFLVGLRYMI